MAFRAIIIAFILVPPLLLEAVEQVNLCQWRKCSPVETQPGDLVFRRDNGVWSWIFIQASKREKRFSHVGIVLNGGRSPVIVHADASELTGIGCVRKQNWAGFFSESVDGALYRYDGVRDVRERIASEACKRLCVPFDTGFDMSNTNKLYCSELIRESVNGATADEVIGYTIVANHKAMVSIDDCYYTNMIKVAECQE